MSTTTIATKQGRHVAEPPSFDNDRLEHLAERGLLVRIIAGRHVACAAALYQAGQAAHCTLDPGHLNRDVPHVYGPARPLARVADADTHETLTGPLPVSDVRAIVVAPTGVGRRVRVEACGPVTDLAADWSPAERATASARARALLDGAR